MIADVQNVYAVLKVYRNDIPNVGDWSNGMTGVSKTLSGSSILSSPVMEKPWEPHKMRISGAFVFGKKGKGNTKGNRNKCSTS